MWAISEARKMDLTRSLLSISRLAGEVYLGSSTYSDSYKVDTILQVKWRQLTTSDSGLALVLLIEHIVSWQEITIVYHTSILQRKLSVSGMC